MKDFFFFFLVVERLNVNKCTRDGWTGRSREQREFDVDAAYIRYFCRRLLLSGLHNAFDAIVINIHTHTIYAREVCHDSWLPSPHMIDWCMKARGELTRGNRVLCSAVACLREKPSSTGRQL